MNTAATNKSINDYDEPQFANSVPIEVNNIFVNINRNCNLTSSKSEIIKQISESKIVTRQASLATIKACNNNNNSSNNNNNSEKTGIENDDGGIGIGEVIADDEYKESIANKALNNKSSCNILTNSQCEYFNDKMIKFNDQKNENDFKSSKLSSIKSSKIIDSPNLKPNNNVKIRVSSASSSPCSYTLQINPKSKTNNNGNNNHNDSAIEEDSHDHLQQSLQLLNPRFVSNSASKHINFMNPNQALQLHLQQNQKNHHYNVKLNNINTNTIWNIPAILLDMINLPVPWKKNKINSTKSKYQEKSSNIHLNHATNVANENAKSNNKNENQSTKSMHSSKSMSNIKPNKTNKLSIDAVELEDIEEGNLKKNPRESVTRNSPKVYFSVNIPAISNDKINTIKSFITDDFDVPDSNPNIILTKHDSASGKLSRESVGFEASRYSDTALNIQNNIRMPIINTNIPKVNIFEKTQQAILAIENLAPNSFRELLTKYIFECDYLSVYRLVKNYKTTPISQEINTADALGNTPFLLACKLAYKHLDYLHIIRELLDRGADPITKDIDGWSALDEAVCQAHVVLVDLILDNLMANKRKKLKKQQDDLKKILDSTPDFYLEMKWDFDSALIPFVSKIAPSDTFKIWKYKSNLRLDNTLVGFKNLKAKRRDMSLIYNDSLKCGKKSSVMMFSINKTKNQYTNIMQDIDEDEKKLIIYDVLKAEPLQGSLYVKECQLLESKSWLGNPVNQKISNWITQKFDLKITLDYTFFKRGKALFKLNHQEYIDKLQEAKNNQNKTGNANKTDNNDPPVEAEIAPAPVEATAITTPKNLNELFQSKNANIKFKTKEDAKTTRKKCIASIWLAKNFPLKFEAIFSALAFLSNGNSNLERLNQILQTNEVKKIIDEESFPVKLQIPISYSIKANITFTKFQYSYVYFPLCIHNIHQDLGEYTTKCGNLQYTKVITNPSILMQESEKEKDSFRMQVLPSSGLCHRRISLGYLSLFGVGCSSL